MLTRPTARLRRPPAHEDHRGVGRPAQVPRAVRQAGPAAAPRQAGAVRQGDRRQGDVVRGPACRSRPTGKMAAGAADALRVQGASEALLLLAAGSSFNGYGKSPSRAGVDPAVRTEYRPARGRARDFAALHKRHVDDHRSLFDRVSLRLDGDPAKRKLPTDQRLVAFRGGGDPDLAALTFQYGRYLLIAGSRPGTQPLNLQGLWNAEVVPPWASAYTININTQMNYWPAEVTNLAETARAAVPDGERDGRHRAPGGAQDVPQPRLGPAPQHHHLAGRVPGRRQHPGGVLEHGRWLVRQPLLGALPVHRATSSSWRPRPTRS